MPVPALDIYMEQGSDFAAQINLIDASQNALNLNNYIVISSMKQSVINPNVAATFNITTVDSSNGIISLGLDAGNTANLMAPYRYLYDILVFDTTSNTRSKILNGNVYVDPGYSTYPAQYPSPPCIQTSNNTQLAANAANLLFSGGLIT